MPAHARHITDWVATAQLHELIEAWPRQVAYGPLQSAVAATRLRVLDELAELKAATMPTAIPRHSAGIMAAIPVIRLRN